MFEKIDELVAFPSLWLEEDQLLLRFIEEINEKVADIFISGIAGGNDHHGGYVVTLLFLCANPSVIFIKQCDTVIGGVFGVRVHGIQRFEFEFGFFSVFFYNSIVKIETFGVVRNQILFSSEFVVVPWEMLLHKNKN